jgi:HlyD family secretion protein
MQHDIQEGQLHAPSDGVIENRILEPGDMASPQKPVLTLALTEPVWVRAYLSETDLGRVPVGARAKVRTDSHPDQLLDARVGYISPTAEFTPKSVETTEIRASLVYQTRIFVCGGKNALRQGMPATVTIALHQTAPAPCPD